MSELVSNPIITLTGSSNCQLTLSDDGESRTHGNNVVTWKCGTGISEIVNITKKQGSDEAFQVLPHRTNPDDPCADWKGTTKHVGEDEEIIEDYKIVWKDTKENQCILDPRIIVNQ